MKHFITSTIILYVCIACSVLLTSCYAFLKADKLIYTGSMAKKPVTSVIVTDSIATTHD